MAKTHKKRALGRGLSALLNDSQNPIHKVSDKNADQLVGNIIDIKVEDIEVNPFQPRVNFDPKTLLELANSIQELGIIQPITVRKVNNKFQLISGERRLRASKMAGLKEIPAYIRLINDKESLEMALVENIQRQDLDPIEIALTYQRLIEEIKLTQENLSKRIGKGRSTITNFLRLLKLDPIIQFGIRDKTISAGHGRALINIENKEDQLELYELIIKRKLSVRQTEELIKKYKELETTEIPKIELPSNFKKSEQDLIELLESKVSIKRTNNGKGKIIIDFKNDEDFKRLTNLLC